MTFELLEFLRTTPDPLETLTSRYGIQVKRHATYPNLAQLKYHQLDSPMGKTIVQQARGIIVDQDDNWRVVCRSFDKFFNHGEGHAASINMEEARVYEKLDGSLTQLYHYDGAWNVASSSRPDAGGTVMDGTITFKELFWSTWDAMGYQLPRDPRCCYAFELLTRYNRVVVRQKQDRVILLGARSLRDFKEKNPVVVAHENQWECAKTYPLGTLDEVVEAAKHLAPMEHEGYVVCDTSYNRVKVKSPAYVALAHLKDGFSTRRMIQLVRTGEDKEFLSYFPEYTDLYCQVKAKFEYLVGQAQGFYDAIQHIEDRKDFALRAKDQAFSGILFGLKHGHVNSVREYVAEMQIKTLEEWLAIKVELQTK